MVHTVQWVQEVMVVVQALALQTQVQQVQHYQATLHKLVKGNYYEYNSKKN
jgi:hypothetical protein